MSWEILKEKNIQQFIKDHATHDPFSLALKAKQYPDIPMQLAVEQIQARQKAVNKLPTWTQCEGIIYPPLLSMEQCSSEITAKYKGELMAGNRLLDLTGGSGVDTYFISRNFEKADYTELWEALFHRTQHNFKCLGAENIDCHFGDGIEFLKQQPDQHYNLIFIDPYRRDEQLQKVFQMEDCLPDVVGLKELLLQKSKKVWIKASPMLDIKSSIRSLKYVQQVHVVSVQNDCKEVLFELENKINDNPQYTAVNFTKKGEKETLSFSLKEETEAIVPCDAPKQHLYEPNSAILKAGGFKSIGVQQGVSKLHPHSHLYTSEALVNDFQGRKFKIIGQEAVNKKALKKYCKDGKGNLTVRNFPATVADLRKKLKLKDGGNIYIFATTLVGEEKVLLVCERV
ncbi:class I SAM-dependent methyltransferase [Persicobacter psychrovividus]|uniref:THUMP-like domain-containing protein n=1 Tax=Persicobacter psychrovividus TaxID=387638 RepID=A0ABM7VGR8_9BACT|nr:hypothetical protein PEPS_24320 [Persicobacter psychrovividus]